jgi:endo-1,4-beta-xylanase
LSSQRCGRHSALPHHHQSLKAKSLLDGIGIQRHQFNVNILLAVTITSHANRLGAIGLTGYVTEFDIHCGSVFPAVWLNANIEGITMWGYITGQTWRDGTGIVDHGGGKRAAIAWLRGCIESTKL